MNEKKKGPRREQWPHWAWALHATAWAILFIILVDWFGAALLFTVFGVGRPEHILLEPSQIELLVSEGVVLIISTSAFFTGVLVIILYFLFWFRKPSNLNTSMDLADPKAAPSLRRREKYVLVMLLLGFAVAVGWTSAALELLVIGEIGKLEDFSIFQIAVIVLFYVCAVSVACGFFEKSGRRNSSKTLKGMKWIAFILFAILLVVLFFDPGLGIRFRIASAMGIVSFAWGYALFEQVRFYAIPKNLSPHYQNPSPQKHLILFVSIPTSDPVGLDGNLTIEKFSQHLSSKIPQIESDSALDSVRQALLKWRRHFVTLDPAFIPAHFSCWLINVLDEALKEIKSKQKYPDQLGPLAFSELVSRISTAVEPGKADSVPGITCHLLAIHLISSLLRTRWPNQSSYLMLSELVLEYQRLQKTHINWLMPIISVEYNLGIKGKREADGNLLEEVACIFSTSAEKLKGSGEFAWQFAWLMEELFMDYYDRHSGSPKFTYYVPDRYTRSLPALREILELNVSKVEGVNFNDYDACSDAVLRIIRECSDYPAGSIAVDFTGGQKTTTMAAVLATTSSDAHSQYIDTNKREMYGFDLRYRDIQALLS